LHPYVLFHLAKVANNLIRIFYLIQLSLPIKKWAHWHYPNMIKKNIVLLLPVTCETLHLLIKKELFSNFTFLRMVKKCYKFKSLLGPNSSSPPPLKKSPFCSQFVSWHNSSNISLTALVVFHNLKQLLRVCVSVVQC
jgi:hypothetical protein